LRDVPPAPQVEGAGKRQVTLSISSKVDRSGSRSMSRENVLVSAAWAEENLDTPGVVFVEVDEDTSAYDAGHIPGAVKIDWKKDLQDPVRRDFVNKEQFEALLSGRGIGNDDTVILYGGNNNWFAAYA